MNGIAVALVWFEMLVESESGESGKGVIRDSLDGIVLPIVVLVWLVAR